MPARHYEDSEPANWVDRVFQFYGLKSIPENLPLHEEQAFFHQLKARPHDSTLKRQFIERYLGLVVSIVKSRRDTVRCLSPEELVDGALACSYRIAVEKYDPNRGFRFTTYATFWIRREISRMIVNEEPTVRLPVYKQELVTKFRREQEALRFQLERVPQPEELAEALHWPIALVHNLLEIVATTSSPLSLDVPTEHPSGDPQSLHDCLRGQFESEEEIIQRVLNPDSVRELLKGLTWREEEVIRRLYGLDGNEPDKRKNLAKELQITMGRLRQHEQRALEKIRSRRAYWLDYFS